MCDRYNEGLRWFLLEPKLATPCHVLYRQKSSIGVHQSVPVPIRGDRTIGRSNHSRKYALNGGWRLVKFDEAYADLALVLPLQGVSCVSCADALPSPCQHPVTSQLSYIGPSERESEHSLCFLWMNWRCPMTCSVNKPFFNSSTLVSFPMLSIVPSTCHEI